MVLRSSRNTASSRLVPVVAGRLLVVAAAVGAKVRLRASGVEVAAKYRLFLPPASLVVAGLAGPGSRAFVARGAGPWSSLGTP